MDYHDFSENIPWAKKMNPKGGHPLTSLLVSRDKHQVWFCIKRINNNSWNGF